MPKAPTAVPGDAGLAQWATAVERADWHTQGKLNGANCTTTTRAVISLSNAVDINEALIIASII